MKKLIALLAGVVIGVSSFAQSKENVEPSDTIVKLGGKKLIVDVTKVTPSYISFIMPNDDEVYTIERKQVEKVIYSSGKIEQFNKPIFQMIEDYQWETVLLTRKEKDIDGLYKRGAISAASAPSRTPKAAKKSATIRMQKKAANLKGLYILVTHEETRGGYGEMPGYYMEGEVYGLEPLDEGEEEASDDGAFENGAVF
ncbi:MAG: hypothetical protein GVY19_08000 [Bacteroidetes bacterium]|jgi:hypothetical protein|nr:hypothetical protein [Bacteroidota bacterium]